MLRVIESLVPGKSVLHMEFTTAGDQIWISARDDNRVIAYDTKTFARLAELPAQSPSGIFFTWRARKMGL
jgi:protein NirF